MRTARPNYTATIRAAPPAVRPRVGIRPSKGGDQPQGRSDAGRHDQRIVQEAEAQRPAPRNLSHQVHDNTVLQSTGSTMHNADSF